MTTCKRTFESPLVKLNELVTTLNYKIESQRKKMKKDHEYEAYIKSTLYNSHKALVTHQKTIQDFEKRYRQSVQRIKENHKNLNCMVEQYKITQKEISMIETNSLDLKFADEN